MGEAILGAIIGAIIAIAAEKAFDKFTRRKTRKRYVLQTNACMWYFLNYCILDCKKCEKSPGLQFVRNMALDAVQREEQPTRHRFGKHRQEISTPPSVCLKSDVFTITYQACLQGLDSFGLTLDSHTEKHLKKQWRKVLNDPEVLYL